jgi:hypothetical protein
MHMHIAMRLRITLYMWELYFNDDQAKLVLVFFHRHKGFQDSESQKPFHSTIYSLDLLRY